MKIGGEIPKVTGVYTKQADIKRSEGTGNLNTKKDVVSISSQAKDYQTAMKALKNVPDIRQDKVEGIRDKYEAGKYEVKEEDIADKILKSITDKK